MNCLECKEPIEQKPGKRAPKFCSTTCRSNNWQKKKRKEGESKKNPKPITFQKPIEKSKKGANSIDLMGNIEFITPTPEAYDNPKIDRDAILAQIKEIEAEEIPKERNTQLGRPAWRLDQKRRINDLKKQL